MARAVVLPPVDREFAKDVSALAREGRKLVDGYARLTEQMLVFAQDFKRLWDRAAKLDGADTGKHHNHLRQAVKNSSRHPINQSAARWITIGSQAKKLMHYKDTLPPYRDSLYESLWRSRMKNPSPNGSTRRITVTALFARSVRFAVAKKEQEKLQTRRSR